LAVLSSNRSELVAIFHASARLRAAITPLNIRLAQPELSHLLAILEPCLVIAEQRLLGFAEGVLGLEELSGAPQFKGADSSADGDPVPWLYPESVHSILFTSGTSGFPKGVELTVANFLASAKASAHNLGGNADQRWLACLPLFHVGGLAMLTRCAWYGAALILQTRFQPEEVIRAAEEDAITHLSLVENALRRVLEARGGRSFPPSLKAALIGGGPVSPELLQRARLASFPALATYGLTEATSQVCTEQPGQADGLSCGTALPGVQIRITNAEGNATAVGEPGEIEVRGPTVMRGYWADEASTTKAFRSGWLRTGDLGALDARGRLRVFSRRTDLILSSGENVYPAEVERVLADHPEVAEVAVVACDDERWGQVPIAFIVARGLNGSSDDLGSWCRVRLASFKVPRQFVFVDALPRNATGKIDRTAIAAQVRSTTGQCGSAPKSARRLAP
jgi:O-succinylbenzoic acid--CoA ligase